MSNKYKYKYEKYKRKYLKYGGTDDYDKILSDLFDTIY